MFKKNKPHKSDTPQAASKTDVVSATAWKRSDRALRREFPGPRGADARLRVAVDRSAYAELIAHAKESLEKEVCGVLVGWLCEDDRGPFVHVVAIIRGNAATQASTHVTFTQETWNQIHKTLDRDFANHQMVGWYHSHPGFGVEFSEMDIFIQKNFFSGPEQIALVMDPLSGGVAICINGTAGIEYLERFWVDGREQPCQVPRGPAVSATSSSPAEGETEQLLRGLETRLNQMVQALDDQRNSFYRFLLFIGTIVCIGVVFWIGYTIYSNYHYRNEPPKLTQYVPIPIQVGDKSVVVGIGVVEWSVPPELNAAMIAVERERREAAEKAGLAETNKSSEAPGSTNSTSVPRP
jgi:proteasome lid subunit RPN8/RPN11